MSWSWWLVASCVRAISMALSSVSVASYSRSFDCTRGLFDPKIKVSIICSSVLVNLHSLTSTRTCLRKEPEQFHPLPV